MALFLGPEYLKRLADTENISDDKHSIVPGSNIENGIWKPTDYYGISVNSEFDEEFSSRNQLGTVYEEIKAESDTLSEFLENCSKNLRERVEPSFMSIDERIAESEVIEAQEILQSGKGACNEYAVIAASMVEKACNEYLEGFATLNGTRVISDYREAANLIGEETARKIGKEIIEKPPEAQTPSYGEMTANIHLWAEHVTKESRTVIDPAHDNVGNPTDFEVYSSYLSGFDW